MGWWCEDGAWVMYIYTLWMSMHIFGVVYVGLSAWYLNMKPIIQGVDYRVVMWVWTWLCMGCVCVYLGLACTEFEVVIYENLYGMEMRCLHKEYKVVVGIIQEQFKKS